MGILSGNNDTLLENELKDYDELQISYMIDEIAHMPDEERKQCIAENAAIWEAKGILGKRTIVRLSRDDDIQRRKHIASLQMAREKNDWRYTKAMEFRRKYKSLLNDIYKVFDSKSNAAAKKGQREYMKNRRTLISKGELSSGRETSASGLNDK